MSEPGQRAFVTGAAGFIGSNLVRLLIEQGYGVTVFDNFSVGKRSYLEGLPVAIEEGDIGDAKAITDAMKGHDHVVHLAAQTGVPLSLENPRRDCELNVLGTLNGLEAARTNGIKTFVFASSNATVGRQPPPAVETAAPLPVSPYGASKLAGEGYCLAYQGSFGLRTVVLRFGNVYGPYCAHKQSVIPRFMRDMQAGTLQVDGDGGQTRDFIYVGDLCQAIIAALRSEVAGEVFQISTGTETSISELADLVMETTHSKLRVEHSPAREGDVRRNYSQIGKAKALLGWEPNVDLRDGLARTWDWMNESGATAKA
jgi:UDP-glucose 4-epimerase